MRVHAKLDCVIVHENWNTNSQTGGLQILWSYSNNSSHLSQLIDTVSMLHYFLQLSTESQTQIKNKRIARDKT